ncbi:DUF6233 domain-containing protein [Streptomyces sp. Je 1-369]|uniref:DUF6233 domain-containing protein n=1 Tax=Streptomyces sp. Je 1-369 TaxID=2966192 RepID=UPI0039E009AC
METEEERGDRYAAGKRRTPVTREEAEWELTRGTRVCTHCRPDSELGVLEYASLLRICPAAIDPAWGAPYRVGGWARRRQLMLRQAACRVPRPVRTSRTLAVHVV